MKALRSAHDFETLKTKGRRINPAPWLVIQWKANTSGEIRLGCTLPRYVGGAVVRNRIRRWCREYVRKWAAPMPDEKTVDINLFFRRQNADFYQELEHQNLDRFLSQGFERIQNHAR